MGRMLICGVVTEAHITMCLPLQLLQNCALSPVPQPKLKLILTAAAGHNGWKAPQEIKLKRAAATAAAKPGEGA